MRSRSQPHTFVENLQYAKRKYEAELEVLADGPERESVLQKISQIENAAKMEGWLRSNLRAPDSTPVIDVGRKVRITSTLL